MKRCGMITLCGRPNVGKSTLTNALVGEKVAIVSSKPQTTRNRICGVLTRGENQFVFLDTPGLHRAANRLGDYMVDVVRKSVADVDAVLLLVEPIPNVGGPERELIDRIKGMKVPAVLVINKLDTVEKAQLLAVMEAYSKVHDFTAIVPISAKRREGLEELLDLLATFLPEGPSSFPGTRSQTSLSGRSAGRLSGKSCCTAWTKRSPTARRWRSPSSPSGTTGSLTCM